MAILIRWEVPDATEISFDKSYVYRATSEAGVYSEITSQAITDNTYDDEDGTLTSWYKIRFYNTSSENWSSYSDAMVGGSYIGYCSLNYFRDMCNIVTDDLTDTEVYSLIDKATAILNADINSKVVREQVKGIDSTRTNEVNGTNTTFYVQHWRGKFIGDSDDNAKVNTSDIVVYAVDSAGTETTPAIGSITPNDGKFTMSTAPSAVTLYVSYQYAPLSESDPDENIKLACAYLSIAFAYEKINRGMSPQQVYGNVRFMRDMKAGNDYFQRYENLITKINSEMGDFAQAEDMFTGHYTIGGRSL